MCELWKSATRWGGRQERGRSGGDGRKNEWKSSEVHTRVVSREQNKLIGEFNMTAGDVTSIRGQVMEYTYIPTDIKRELVRFCVDDDQKG